MEVTNLESMCFDVDKAKGRYTNLLNTFRQPFEGNNPHYIVRSPGRFNIIGDHIDYSNFPCLPAAITFDVIVAIEIVTDEAAPGSKNVQLMNTGAKSSPFTFESDSNVKKEASF